MKFEFIYSIINIQFFIDIKYITITKMTTIISRIILIKDKNVNIQFRSDGYVDATNLCIEHDILCGNWLKDKSIINIIQKLSEKTGIPINELTYLKYNNNSHALYIHPELVWSFKKLWDDDVIIQVMNVCNELQTKQKICAYYNDNKELTSAKNDDKDNKELADANKELVKLREDLADANKFIDGLSEDLADNKNENQKMSEYVDELEEELLEIYIPTDFYQCIYLLAPDEKGYHCIGTAVSDCLEDSIKNKIIHRCVVHDAKSALSMLEATMEIFSVGKKSDMLYCLAADEIIKIMDKTAMCINKYSDEMRKNYKMNFKGIRRMIKVANDVNN